MFDLESSIAAWRRHMLAAGIQTPVPLEELENHLRDEIARRVGDGASNAEAFTAAVTVVGNPGVLKAEFKEAGGFWEWLGEDRTARLLRTFALLWLAFCSWIFFSLAVALAVTPFLSNFRMSPDFYLIILFAPIFLRGMIAAVRLFGGNRKEARVLRVLAVIGFAAGIAQILVRNMPKAIIVSWLDVVVMGFYVASFYLLRPPKKPTSVKN